MFQLRPNCEVYNKDLPPDAQDARICTYECTCCADCFENVPSLENPRTGRLIPLSVIAPLQKLSSPVAIGT